MTGAFYLNVCGIEEVVASKSGMERQEFREGISECPDQVNITVILW